MAKKGHKLLAFAAITAAAAGAYYYFKNNNKEVPVNMGEDDEDDFINEDLDEVDEKVEKAEKRTYVSLDSLEQKVRDAADKVTDVAGKAATQIGDAIKKGSERVEEFFDDRKTASEPVVNSEDDYVEASEATNTEASETKTEE